MCILSTEKMRYLKVENYVLFRGLSEDLSLSESFEGLLQTHPPQNKTNRPPKKTPKKQKPGSHIKALDIKILLLLKEKPDISS